MGGQDDGAYPPVRVTLPEAPETASRWAALNILFAIPHFFVLVLFYLAAVMALVVGWFAVLFTGTWPPALRDFLVRVSNYWLRVWAYVTMVVTEYPRFGLAG